MKFVVVGTLISQLASFLLVRSITWQPIRQAGQASLGDLSWTEFHSNWAVRWVSNEANKLSTTFGDGPAAAAVLHDHGRFRRTRTRVTAPARCTQWQVHFVHWTIKCQPRIANNGTKLGYSSSRNSHASDATMWWCAGWLHAESDVWLCSMCQRVVPYYTEHRRHLNLLWIKRRAVNYQRI
jgi:hypothetical protein